MRTISLIQSTNLLVFNVCQTALLSRHRRLHFVRGQSLARVRTWSVAVGAAAEVSPQIGHFGVGLLLSQAQGPQLPPTPLQEGMVRDKRLDNAPGGGAVSAVVY